MGSRNALVTVVVLLAGAGGLWWFLSGDGGSADARSTGPVEAARPGAVAQPGANVTLTPPGEVDDDAAVSATPERVVVESSEPELAMPDEPAELDEDAMKVSGRVVDGLGNPVEGALVFAAARDGFPLDYVVTGSAPPSWLDRFTAETDADGRFELVGPQPGNLRVEVQAAGYAPYKKDGIALPDAEEFELDTVSLELGARLAGRVVDPSGRAVAGAELQLVESEGPFRFFFMPGVEPRPAAVTDETGSFAIDRLACGAWKIEVETDDFPDRTFEGLAERPGELVGGLEFRLEPGNVVMGQVEGVPADERGKLEVRATPREDSGWFDFGGGGRSGDVDADGNFEVRGLVVDAEYDLQVRKKPDGERNWFSGRTRSDKVPVRSGERGVSIAYMPEAVVLMQVVDASTGAPVTEMEVSSGFRWKEPLMGADGKLLREHPEGRVRIGNLRPTSDDDMLELEIEAVGYRSYERDDIRVPFGGDVDLGVIRLEPIPVVRVTVLDDDTGEPVPGATITLNKERKRGGFGGGRRVVVEISDDDEEVSFGGGGKSGKTDENGVGIVSSIEGETCYLVVHHSEYAPVTLTDLFLPEGQVVEKTVRLGRGGTVVVYVRDEAGQPVAGARVDHRAPDTDIRSRGFGFFGYGHGSRDNITDTEGKVTFGHLAEGVHGFKLESDAGHGAFYGGGAVFLAEGAEDEADPGWEEVDVGDGTSATIQLVKATLATLAGRVTEAGVDLTGATLRLNPEQKNDELGMARIGHMFGGGPEARSDGNGHYSFEDVEPGSYTLSVSHPKRRMPMEFDVVVKDGANSFDADLPVSIVEGRITDTEGNPLPDLKVTADRYSGEGPRQRMIMSFVGSDGGGVVSMGDGLGEEATFTDADGRYRLRGVVPNVELVINATGDMVQPGRSDPIMVEPDEVRSNVNFTLLAGGSVKVEIFTADGSPAQFCMVRGNYVKTDDDEEDDGQGTEPKFSFAQAGSTTLTGMRPGRWSISVNPAGPGNDNGNPDDQVVEVEPGETVTATFHLP